MLPDESRRKTRSIPLTRQARCREGCYRSSSAKLNYRLQVALILSMLKKHCRMVYRNEIHVALCEQAYSAFHILNMHIHVIHIPPTQSDKSICIP